jgi:hypothetical protein
MAYAVAVEGRPEEEGAEELPVVIIFFLMAPLTI